MQDKAINMMVQQTKDQLWVWTQNLKGSDSIKRLCDSLKEVD